MARPLRARRRRSAALPRALRRPPGDDRPARLDSGQGHSGRGSGPRSALDAATVVCRNRTPGWCAGVRRLAVGSFTQDGYRWRRPRHTLVGRQEADAVERSGVRLKLLRQQAEAGDIDLLFVDESEALTHPYLARCWALRGTDLRIPA